MAAPRFPRILFSLVATSTGSLWVCIVAVAFTFLWIVFEGVRALVIRREKKKEESLGRSENPGDDAREAQG